MADVVDSCSEGVTLTCPHCGYKVEHMYVEVAKGILANHERGSMEEAEVYVCFCPRCDRMKFGLSPEAALLVVIEHVQRVHPEYDPLWYREEEIHVP